MKKDALPYIRQSVKNYIEVVGNLIVFFPYFFSFIPLLKTLFYPWKHIVTKKEIRGFSFSEYFNRLLLNLMSSCIGASMRMSLISFFILFETIYILTLPITTIIYMVFVLPINTVFFLTQPTDEEVKEKRKNVFMASHCLKGENTLIVSSWFEELWSKEKVVQKWWDKKTLFSYPPLARDWAVGYTPTLDVYVEDLTSSTYQSTPRHIVGRKNELEEMQEVLSKSEEANIVLVGEEGVGKRTVLDALARLIYEGQTGKQLAYKRILKLNMEKILTTFTDMKQREQFFEELMDEATQAEQVIILIENIDKYCASNEGRIDLTGSFEKYARKSTIQFVGITTPFFYQRFIFSNEKMNRLFTRIDVKEIAKEEALSTILHIIPQFELKYNLTIPFETGKAVIEKSEFYITSIPFPEKAIELLDQTASHVYTKQEQKNAMKQKTVVFPELVDVVLTEKTHIPTRMTDDMRKKLLALEHLLEERVVFQSDAISQLSAAIRRSFILLGKRKKPLATFLFLGPTGVGKTETAKALSSIFFGNDSYLTRFDMSLYQSKDDIKTLVGSLESGQPGLLSKAIRELPYAVLLLDELEKAHADLINMFLTVIDEGYFTDGFGKRVDCKNLIIIATSNAGADFIYKQQGVLNKLSDAIQEQNVIDASQSATASLIDHLIQSHIFSPEFLNRFDGVISYNAISNDAIMSIAKKMSQSVQDTIFSLYQIKLSIKDETLLAAIQKHYNPRFGARNLEHVVTTEIEDKIATLLLEKKVGEGQTIIL
ncbi:MAG: AAA family ATPase [Microgenomates group bacterium]